MIVVRKSPTADTRSCNYAEVSEQQLRDSSLLHMEDVRNGLNFFKQLITQASNTHDDDKLSCIKEFYSDFLTGFKNTTWLTNHKKINRHHLADKEGIREDVNLIDILEFITDCVMAGMARTGIIFPLNIDQTVLQKAFENTVKLLKKNIMVKGELIASEKAEKASNEIYDFIALQLGLFCGETARKNGALIIQKTVIEPLEDKIKELEKYEKIHKDQRAAFQEEKRNE